MRQKDKIKERLISYQLDGIERMAKESCAVVRDLHYFIYDKDPSIAWRAAEAMGRVSVHCPGQAELLVDRFLWSMNEESGSIGWYAAETLGEIARNAPHLVIRIIPTMVHYLNMRATRRGCLWFLGQLGTADPQNVGATIPMVVPHLKDSAPEIRAHAALALARMQAKTTAELLEQLLQDQDIVKIYDGGQLVEKTVAQVAAEAREALKKLPG
jgi:HEAT repeat protein